MNRFFLSATLSLIAVSSILASCGDATGPAADTPVVVIHAAPGRGAMDVRLDGAPLRASLPAGQGVRDSVAPGDHDVVLDGDGVTLEVIEPVAAGTALGVVLMNGQASTIRTYLNNVVGSGGVRFMVINAVPNTDLTVTLDGTRSQAGLEGLPYTGSDQFSLDAGDYDVTVHAGDPSAAVDLGTLRLDRGRVFIVFYPNPGGPEPWAVGVY